jgi:hypothetical protein
MINPDELERAVERLTGCADDDEAHWSMDPREGWAVDVPVSDLRLILSANREMREALEPFSEASSLYADELRPDLVLSDVALIDTSLTLGDLRKARSALTTQRGDGE